MTSSPGVLAIDLGKSRCRAVIEGAERTEIREAVGAPGLADADGVSAALASIRPLLDAAAPFEAVAVGAAGAWAAPSAASVLARRLASDTGVATVVTSDVVTAHVGALGGREGVLLIAGTGAAALGVDADGARLIDGWGPELGDFGSGSWLGREALRAVLRAASGLGPRTVLADAIAEPIGAASDIPAWLARTGPLPRRLATLAPLVLDAAVAGDLVAGEVAALAVRLLIDSAVAASVRSADVVLHGGLTDHSWFRDSLTAGLEGAGRTVVPAAGDALDGAILLSRRLDLPHERFVHRAAG